MTWKPILLTYAAAAVLTACSHGGVGSSVVIPPVSGVVPEGIWVLDQVESKTLEPVSHTLWIIKDDGEELVWVSVQTGEDGEHKITNWHGVYGGEPSTVSGSGFVASLRRTGEHSMETYGEIPQLGDYSEKCQVQPAGDVMICNGEVSGEQGTMSWLEKFDRVSPSPHTPLLRAE
tara:strand:- start:19276 stop:19800 length:525 start_codon:yes stop_codon:yes gene_type:complete